MFSFTFLMYSTCYNSVTCSIVSSSDTEYIPIAVVMKHSTSHKNTVTKFFTSVKKCYVSCGSKLCAFPVYSDTVQVLLLKWLIHWPCWQIHSLCEIVCFCKQIFASPFDYTAHLPHSCSQKPPLFATELYLGLHLCWAMNKWLLSCVVVT